MPGKEGIHSFRSINCKPPGLQEAEDQSKTSRHYSHVEGTEGSGYRTRV